VKEGDQLVTRLIEQDGPIAYVESTTVARIDDEDANRCWLLASDFLAYRDRDGQVADFHALRHTFVTNLVNAGVDHA
jgi:hypothetical protein